MARDGKRYKRKEMTLAEKTERILHDYNVHRHKLTQRYLNLKAQGLPGGPTIHMRLAQKYKLSCQQVRKIIQRSQTYTYPWSGKSYSNYGAVPGNNYKPWEPKD